MKANIEDHLRVVLGLAGENDLVIVGFSGHGVHLDGKSYLCSSEARPDDPSTMIALEDVYARCFVSSSAARASTAYPNPADAGGAAGETTATWDTPFGRLAPAPLVRRL